jgi:hypothetical protein
MSRNASRAHVAKNSRVLVVEDEWLIADEVCYQLLKAGYRVVGPAPSVHEALSFIGCTRASTGNGSEARNARQIRLAAKSQLNGPITGIWGGRS